MRDAIGARRWRILNRITSTSDKSLLARAEEDLALPFSAHLDSSRTWPYGPSIET
jgi:hypothetical protein